MKKKAILGIETSASTCSIALFSEEELIAEKIDSTPNAHAHKIAPFAEELIEIAKENDYEIIAIAISNGPGSYTGLRIGSAFAKGYAFAKNIPIIAISTLKSISSYFIQKEVIEEKSVIIPMIDAGRMEVYTCVLNQSIELLSPISAQIIDEKSFSEYEENEAIYFIGTGALKCKEVLPLKNASFQEIIPMAHHLQYLAFQYYKSQEFVDTAYWEPDYIKPYKVVVAKNKVLNR